MGSKYRLNSSVFERKDKSGSEDPLKVFFLSVEGNDTEVEYFEGVKKYRSVLGISAVIDIEVLKRKKSDTRSAPAHVIELLEEFIELRGKDDEYFVNELSSEFINKYDRDFIYKFLYSPELIPKKERNIFINDLNAIGYDIEYRKYLTKYNNGLDEFCVVIDRDRDSHTNIEECLNYCRKKNYRVYITNPCFEFWLLLHLADAEEKYSYADLAENKKITNTHTFVSSEVSKIAGHGKQYIRFEKNYLHNIDTAIEGSKKFETNPDSLIHKVGTNLGALFEKMRGSL